MSEEKVNCSACHARISWMEVFPKGVCVECHARNTEHLTARELYEQVVDGFGNGRVINTQTKKGRK